MPETTTNYGRQNVAWPDLGHDGGQNLHTAITSSVKMFSDQISRVWSGSQTVDANTSISMSHNFGMHISNLKIRFIENGAELSETDESVFLISEIDANSFTVTNNDSVTRTIEIYAEPKFEVRNSELSNDIESKFVPKSFLETQGNNTGLVLTTSSQPVSFNVVNAVGITPESGTASSFTIQNAGTYLISARVMIVSASSPAGSQIVSTLVVGSKTFGQIKFTEEPVESFLCCEIVKVVTVSDNTAVSYLLTDSNNVGNLRVYSGGGSSSYKSLDITRLY